MTTSCRVRRSSLYKWIALAAVVYCLWAIIGGDPATVVHAMVALLISVPLYPFFIRSMEAARKRKELTHAARAAPPPTIPPPLRALRDEGATLTTRNFAMQ